jgi:hypothetical protein
MIALPRQARDKHRESTPKKREMGFFTARADAGRWFGSPRVFARDDFPPDALAWGRWYLGRGMAQHSVHSVCEEAAAARGRQAGDVGQQQRQGQAAAAAAAAAAAEAAATSRLHCAAFDQRTQRQG